MLPEPDEMVKKRSFRNKFFIKKCCNSSVSMIYCYSTIIIPDNHIWFGSNISVSIEFDLG